MKNKFILEIVTPKGMIFSGDAKEAQLPGSEGELGVLPNHAPLVTLLNAGLIEVTDLNGDVERVAINWGYLKVSEEKVTVLADGAVYIGGKKDGKIAQAIEKAKELIESMGSETTAYAATIARLENL